MLPFFFRGPPLVSWCCIHVILPRPKCYSRLNSSICKPSPPVSESYASYASYASFTITTTIWLLCVFMISPLKMFVVTIIQSKIKLCPKCRSEKKHFDVHQCYLEETSLFRYVYLSHSCECFADKCLHKFLENSFNLLNELQKYGGRGRSGGEGFPQLHLK